MPPRAPRTASRRIIHAARPGMTEYDAVRAMMLDGFHAVRPHQHVRRPPRQIRPAQPSIARIEKGDPIVVGFRPHGRPQLPGRLHGGDARRTAASIRDYVEKLVAPYFERRRQAWYDTVGIGVAGGTVYDAVMSRLADPFFGIGLNPGHLIHLDEWVHSPMKKGSTQKLVSGMALQCDIIPATGTTISRATSRMASRWPTSRSARRIRARLSGSLGTHQRAPRLHGASNSASKAEAGSSALQQHRGLAAALLDVAPQGHDAMKRQGTEGPAS
jgi:hypothetical protein